MDKRYRFIRSKDPFEGLDDYRIAPYLRLKSKSLWYPVQHSLFNEEKEGIGAGLRTKEGNFFELIANGIYGGIKKLSYTNKSEDNGNQIIIEPDITDKKKGIFHEIKGVYKSREVKLTDEQITKYILLQSRDYFPNPPIIRFDIFRHNLNQIQNKYKNKGLEELIAVLPSSLTSFISLPFSVIFEFYVQDDKKKSKNRRFTSRHDDKRTYDTLTRFHSTGLNELLAYPEETLKEFGFNPERFKFEKRRFPKTITVNDFNINPFPMLFIYDKDYSSFVNELKERINSNKTLLYRIYEETKGLIGEKNPCEEELLELQRNSYEEIPSWLQPLKNDAPF